MTEVTKERMEAALRMVIPCLEDWCRSTGYGRTYERDRAALEASKAALAASVAEPDDAPRNVRHCLIPETEQELAYCTCGNFTLWPTGQTWDEHVKEVSELAAKVALRAVAEKAPAKWVGQPSAPTTADVELRKAERTTREDEDAQST